MVEGNTIGLDVTGSIPVGNTGDGIFLTSSSNTIGGAGSAGNVISANTVGINLDNASFNTVQGNLIGTDALGTGGFGNAAEGILVKNSSSNQIGGAGALRNVIADNASSGIQMNGSSTANVVEGNYIGVDISSSVALANGGNGVFLNNVSGNFVGSGGAGNVISGNASSGVLISGLTATGNVVEGNTIGLDMTGTIAVGNGLHGVFVENATLGNTIGGLAGNVISANTVGISLDNASTNAVYGNLIGTDALGTGGFGNAAEGILVKNSSTNQIGGAGALRNVIADNAIGIQMNGSSTGNVVEGNYIGVDISGLVALANAGNGVQITSLSAGNRIGGTVAGLENTIAYNGLDGLFLFFRNRQRDFLERDSFERRPRNRPGKRRRCAK